MKLKKALSVLTLGAILCVGTLAIAPQPVRAADPPVVGTLDEDKLADGYTAYKKALDDIDARAKAIDRQLEARELLSPDEGKQFDTLILKSPRSAAEDGQLQALVTSGSNRRTEYLALIAKGQRTPEEEAKIKQYLEYSKGNDGTLRTLSDKLFGQIKQEQDDAEKKYTDQANNVIADVAKKKGLKVVVRKRAVVWSDDALDITKDVLSQLNK